MYATVIHTKCAAKTLKNVCYYTNILARKRVPLTRIETFRIFSQFGVSIGIHKYQLHDTSLNRNRGNCIDEGTGRSEGNIQAVSEQLKNNAQYVNGHHVKRLYHSCFSINYCNFSYLYF